MLPESPDSFRSASAPVRRRRCALAALAVVLGACGNERPANYFPLDPGRHWQYRVERTTMDGTRELRHAVATRAAPPDYAGIRETLGGALYYYVRDDEGLWRVAPDRQAATGSRTATGPELVLPATPDVGRAWQGKTTTAVLENTGPPWETLFRIAVPVAMNFRITATDAVVDTPAGRFEHCLEVVGEGRTNTDAGNYIGRTVIEVRSTEWYAPGVGLVRLEREERTAAEALDHGRLVMALDRWWRE